MSKVPFYRIFVGEEEITDMVTSFSYEDSVEKDDLLKISIESKDVNLPDDERFKKQQELKFEFGYIAGKKSALHIANITDIEVNYGQNVKLTITALDKGNAMKQESKSKIWKNRTGSEIAERIAQNRDLIPVIDSTSFVYENLPQADKTDFELLKYLAEREQEGSFRFFIKDRELHFNRLNLEQESSRTYTYAFGEGTVLSFKPAIKGTKNQQNKASIQTATTVHNPLTGDTFTQKVDSSNAEDNTQLGTNFASYDADGNRVAANNNARPQSVDEKEQITGMPIIAPPTIAPQEISNQMNNAQKTATQEEITATLVIEGDPEFEADGIITIKGVAQSFEGNWYVKSAKHKPSGGYKTTVELSRNATNSATTASTIGVGVGGISIPTLASLEQQQSGNVNTSIGGTGAEEASPQKGIPSYDANGNRIN